MAYSDVAALKADNDFIYRTIACVAVEGGTDPDAWQNEHGWDMAASPGFGDKYGYALSIGISRPGYDPSVIADAEILSAVQAIGTDPPADA